MRSKMRIRKAVSMLLLLLVACGAVSTGAPLTVLAEDGAPSEGGQTFGDGAILGGNDDETPQNGNTDVQNLSASGVMPGGSGIEEEVDAIMSQAFDAIVETMSGGYGQGGKFLAPIEAPVAGSIPISSREDMEKIGNTPDYPLNGEYHLTRDIDLSGAAWEPIGDSTSARRFKGTFDGQGHVIRNLTISGNYEYAGLFSYSMNATIINTGLEGANISLSSSSRSYTGGICGLSSNSPIINCYNTGSVYASSTSSSLLAYTGGICGYSSSNSPISYCYTTGSVSSSASAGGAYTGGICGYASSSISDCYSTGSASASSTYVARAGGVCGSTTSPITNCYNSGFVFASSAASNAYTGGISAFSHSISSCYNIGPVSAYSNCTSSNSYVGAGGICGNTSSVSNCYNTGSVSASSAASFAYAGGIYCHIAIGAHSVNNCYNTGGVSASSTSAAAYTGGICGNSNSGSSSFISNCYWNTMSDQMINGSSVASKKGLGAGADTTTPLTSAQMRTAANFAGFDFTNVWGITSSINNGYPYLIWKDNPASGIPDEIVITVKALDKNGISVPVEGATVALLTMDGREVFDSSTGSWKTDKNGKIYIQNSIYLQNNKNNLFIYAYLDQNFKTSNPDPARSKARSPYGDVLYTLRLSSLNIGANGSRYADNFKWEDKVLTLKTPLFMVNLSVAYYIPGREIATQDEDYYDDVVFMMREAGYLLSQATDGYFSINKVAIYPTTNKDSFYNPASVPGSCDIRIEAVNGIISNSVTSGLFDDGTDVIKDEKFGGPGKKSHARIQMSKTSATNNYRIVNSKVSKKTVIDRNDIAEPNYAAEFTHELGHYILSFLDEYKNAIDTTITVGGEKITDPTKTQWKYMTGGRPVNLPDNFGLMEDPFTKQELSRSNDYSYLPKPFDQNENNKKIATNHYYTYGFSCWDMLKKIFEIENDTTFQIENRSPSENKYYYKIEYPSKVRTAEYFTPLHISEIYNIDPTRNTSTSSLVFSSAGLEPQEYPGTLALIAFESDNEVVITPLAGEPQSLKLGKFDGDEPVEVASVSPVGGKYNIEIDHNEAYYLRLESLIDGDLLVYNDYDLYLYDGSPEISCVDWRNNVQLYLTSVSEADISYVVLGNTADIEQDGYISVAQATGVWSTDGEPSVGALRASSFVYDNIDLNTLSWFVFRSGCWEKLDTTICPGEYTLTDAECGYAGDGIYVLMAKQANNELTLAPVNNFTVEPDNTFDGNITITFDDPNPSGDIRYYELLYSDEPFIDASGETVSCFVFNAGDNEYGLNIVTAETPYTTPYYFALRAKSYDGSYSPLSEIVTSLPGVRHSIHEVIPDWWINMYWLDSEEGDIASMDLTGDGYTNLEKYLLGIDPRFIVDSGGQPSPGAGDVNSDNQINMQDVLLIYQYFRGKTTLEGDGPAAADVNGDGAVNMMDVLMVYQYFRGKVTGFPAQ